MLFGGLKWRSPHLYLFAEGDDGGGGGGGDNDLGWRANLPEDLRNEAALASFKDEQEMISMPINVAKSFVHTKKLVGADVIKVPKSDDEWQEVYNRLGRPESADLYVLPQPEGIHEDLKDHVGKDAEWFRETAHKHGLTDAQASALFQDYTKRLSDTYTTNMSGRGDAVLDTEVKLRTEFGATYDAKRVIGDRALEAIGGSELMNLVNQQNLNANPAFVRLKFKLGEMMAEDLGLDKATGELLISPESMQEEMTALMNSKAYLDKSHPEHHQVFTKVKQMMERIHGTKAIPETVRM